MNEKEFLQGIAEILEVDENNINLNTDFRNDIEDFDSLKGFGIIVFIDDECGVKVSLQQFLESKVIGDLYKLATGE